MGEGVTGDRTPLFELDYRLVKTCFRKYFQFRLCDFIFIMLCNFRFELHLDILIFLTKKKAFEIGIFFWKKNGPPLWKCLDPPLGYVYIVVQCELSWIVEDGTTISVVDCVKFSVLVNQCVRPLCSLVGSTYPQKPQRDSPYNVSFLFYG